MAYKIDHGEFIEVNGDRQSLRYRAAAEGLPVILFLHGGPGVCDRHLVLGAHSAMAERYTMVCWDQRGSGKSYNRQLQKSDISLDTYVEDAEFVLEYLAGKFGVRRVIVSGHSWGTAIGTALAAKRPDLVAAYIGQGHFVNGDRQSLRYRAGCPTNSVSLRRGRGETRRRSKFWRTARPWTASIPTGAA